MQRWAIETVKSLDPIDSTTFEDMEIVMKWLMSVMNFDLIQNTLSENGGKYKMYMSFMLHSLYSDTVVLVFPIHFFIVKLVSVWSLDIYDTVVIQSKLADLCSYFIALNKL